MTRPNRFDSQEGVIIHGRAYTRSQVLGIKCECYLVLRQSVLPLHVLEKYDSTRSSSAVVIVLKNIIVNPSGKRGFVLISSAGVLHQFVIESEALVTPWIKNIQNLSCFEPLTLNSRELYSDVVPCGLSLSLLPSTALNYHGRCYLVVSDRDICLHEVDDSARIVVSWPLNAIRSYGINKKVFTLKTGRSTVTGRAEFIFEVSKPLTPFHVYQEVASKVHNSQSTMNEISDPVLIEAPGDTGHLIAAEEADDGYDFCNQPPADESVLDSAAPGEPSTSIEQHADSDESPSKDVVYRQLPLVHSITCQLPSKSFLSVFGLDEAVARLKALLGRESRFRNCSVLLYGPPDSGKGTLANALAMESEARFVCLDCANLATKLGADDLSYLRETFECILALRPCVLLLKHVEVVPSGFERSELGFTVLKAILDLLDRAASNPRLLVVCSTTQPTRVDDSLLTRLSEQIYVPLPSATARSHVLKDRLRLCASSEAEPLVKGLVLRTCGCSVAQLLELCHEVERVKREDHYAQSSTAKRQHQMETVALTWFSENVAPWSRARMESVESCASYFVKRTPLQDTFLVTLEGSPALPDIDLCFLKVTSSGIELRDLDPTHLIVSWSRKTIRGFGTALNLFQMETGRSSSTGEAFFNFKTDEADAIQKMIETRCSTRQSIPESSSAPAPEYGCIA